MMRLSRTRRVVYAIRPKKKSVFLLLKRVTIYASADGLVAAGTLDPALVAAIGIATSLFAIVTASTLTGSALPFALAAAGQDPANAGTAIQVCMDVAGVVITCVVCSAVFEHFGGVAELGTAASFGVLGVS